MIPEASSQQFTTSTTLQTSTWTQTSAYTIVSYYSATTGVGTASITAKLTPALNGLGNCSYYSAGFESAGATVHVHFSASQPMVLYVQDVTDVINSATSPSANPCFPTSYQFQSSPSSSGNFNVSLHDNPNLLLIRPANMQNVVSPTFSLTIGPISNVPLGSTQLPIEMTSTLTGTSTSTDTTTLTSLTRLEVPFMQTYGGWIVAAIVAAAVVLGAAFLYSRRRAQLKVSKSEKLDTYFTQSSTKATSNKRLCVECGNEMPPNLKFCDSCATKQP